MQIFVYFSSTCFGPIRPSSGAIEFIISFTNAAYGVLGAARCLSVVFCSGLQRACVLDRVKAVFAGYKNPNVCFSNICRRQQRVVKTAR